MQKNGLLSKVIGALALFVTVMVFIGILNPSLFFTIINIFWFVIFVVTLTIVTLGVLTFVGRKDEAKTIINLFIEGSMTVIDVVDFLNVIWKTFIQVATDAILVAIPYLGIVLSGLLYFLIMLIYKVSGKYIDVTIPTIILTVLVTLFAGVMTLPKKEGKSARIYSYKVNEALKKFKRSFVDSFEIVIFLLFLTIDSPRLFFIPESLHGPIRASVGDYDLMIRGFVLSDHLQTTVKIIGIMVFLELLRRFIRVGATFRKYYRNIELVVDEEQARALRSTQKVKPALRKTVALTSDDFLMFATFNVFILLVFLMFPRLKLLTLICASVTALVLDLLFPARLTSETASDLLSRIFQKIIELNPLIKRKAATS